MVIKGTDNHGYEFTISGYTLTYDFRTPGGQTVEVKKDGKTIDVTGLTAVGLSGLSVTSGDRNSSGGTERLPPFSPSTFSYSLGGLMAGTYIRRGHEIWITASAPSGMSLTFVTSNGRSGTLNGRTSVEPDVPLGYQTITVTVTYNSVTRNYTVSYTGNSP
jgi:hypothetical protein